MAVITLKAAGALIVTNAAAAASSATITTAQMTAIGNLLQLMDQDKNLAPLLKLSATDQLNLSTTS